MRRTIAAALLAAGLVATGISAVASAASDHNATSGTEATLSMAAQRLLPHWRDHRLLLIGEIHGTQETPALVAALLRAQPRTVPVLLGLEIPRQEQATVDAFLASTGNADARRALAKSAFWRNDMQDGRSSAAMLDLLDAVRALRVGGATITVVCFDDAQPAADGLDRDAHMAHALRSALDADRKRRALVLTGNYHVRIARGSQWNPRQEFMAWHLRDLDPFPIDVTAPTGSYWACTPSCGINAFGADHRPGALALTVSDGIDANGYRGTLSLPTFNASAPAMNEPVGG